MRTTNYLPLKILAFFAVAAIGTLAIHVWYQKKHAHITTNDAEENKIVPLQDKPESTPFSSCMPNNSVTDDHQPDHTKFVLVNKDSKDDVTTAETEADFNRSETNFTRHP